MAGFLWDPPDSSFLFVENRITSHFFDRKSLRSLLYGQFSDLASWMEGRFLAQNRGWNGDFVDGPGVGEGWRRSSTAIYCDCIHTSYFDLGSIKKTVPDRQEPSHGPGTGPYPGYVSTSVALTPIHSATVCISVMGFGRYCVVSTAGPQCNPAI